jgi:hypothetical protein
MNNIKKYIAILALGLFTKNSIAQTGIVVGINGFGYKSNLYNQLDKKADARLDYVKSYGSSYGIEVGWQFNKTLGFTINPKISKVNQDYMGDAEDFQGKYKSTIETNLKYISIPLVIHGNFGNSKLKLTTSVGIQYSSLKKYKDYFKKEYASFQSENNINRIISNNNFDFNYIYNFESINVIAITDKFIYKKNVFGLNAGLGVLYDINKTIQVYSKINSEYSLFDVENKEGLDLKITKGTNVFGNKKYEAHSLPIKYTLGSDPTIIERENTHIFNLGLILGLRFIISQ